MRPVPHASPASRSNRLRRNGPLVLTVVTVVALGAVTVVGGGDDGERGGDRTTTPGGEVQWTSAAATGPGAPVPTGQMPVTYAEAEADGALDEQAWPDTCDTDQGTVELPSVYALPCVPTPVGGNGGATARGVTADAVKVVYYAPATSADLAAILGGMGLDDSAEQRLDTLQAFVDIQASVAETYGRRIEVVPFAASGASNDPVASTADAIDVIAMDPFAVVGGPALDRGTFAQAIAEAGIPCYGCGSYLPDDMVLDMAPYLWDTPPSPNQFLGMLQAWTEAGERRTSGEVAAFAGGDLRGRPRKVGAIHFEQDPPIYGETAEDQEGRFGRVDLTETYVLDMPSLPAKATELIAKFKAEGITTVVFMGDPFMPGYLTRAATAQRYHPEWIFTGTALTDTNALARSWDPGQMERAYGISQLAAPTDQDLQEPIRLYRWYRGDGALPPARNQYALLAPPAAWLVAGIHMAGPELTAETFARGLFRIPPRGGGPSNPQISYGSWGVFPDMDYQAIDDAVEIWWDGTVEAPDERGTMGVGAWRRSDGGRRFTIDGAPAPRPFADRAHALTVVDELTPEDSPPSYPPPPGAPAARSSVGGE